MIHIDNPISVLFNREQANKDRHALSLFLCHSRRGRAIVSHYGRTGQSGEWTCHRHRNGCEHIAAARENAVFHQFVEKDAGEALEGGMEEEDERG